MTKRDWIIAAIAGFGMSGAMVAGAWLLVVFVLAPMNKPSEVSVPAKVATEVKRAPTVRVKVPSVKVYAGDAKAKLKLPAEALTTPAEHVVAASKVPASERPQTVTTTINTDTGEFRSFVKQDPYPWFAIERRGEVRLSAGYKFSAGRSEPVVRLGASYDVVRVKALTAGVVGSIDSDGDTFVGIGIAYRF